MFREMNKYRNVCHVGRNLALLSGSFVLYAGKFSFVHVYNESL